MSLFSECRLQRLSEGFDIDSFDCSDSDLSEFLKKDALPFMKELLGVTYVFTPNRKPKEIVSFFTVSNDLIRVDTLYGSARKRIHSFIPSSKRMRAYPAVKIGRLGVDKKYHSKGVGSQMMDFIKGWFTDGRNKTGCRFIVVDAYNEAAVLRYYSKNSFQFLMDEQKEKEEFNPPQSQLRTRIMYYNLLKLTT